MKFDFVRKIPETVLSVAALGLFVRNRQAFLVGGAVRDLMMGRTPKDWDLATDATPDEIIKSFSNSRTFNTFVVGHGEKHGTVGVHDVMSGMNVEITTFRKDVECDGRHSKVVFAKTIEEDLSRRDFTFNAMAVNLKNFEFIDLFDGQKDLEDHIIRLVGDSTDRIKEDYLRMLRAVRFMALDDRMEFDGLLSSAICKYSGNITQVSVERQTAELIKLLMYPKPSRAIREAISYGLLDVILPELSSMDGMGQNRWHEVYECSRCGKEFVKILEDNFVGFYSREENESK